MELRNIFITMSTKIVEKTDAELVELALENQAYFSDIVYRYQTKLTYYIRRLSNFPDEEIEDILQDVFIKVYKNLNDFDQSLKFSSWIYRITHNEVISKYRKIKQQNIISIEILTDDILNKLEHEVSIVETLENNEKKEIIKQVLALMDLKYREVLVLKYFEELDYKEISDVLKKPTGTIATLLNRAKKQFNKTCIDLNLKYE